MKYLHKRLKEVKYKEEKAMNPQEREDVTKASKAVELKIWAAIGEK